MFSRSAKPPASGVDKMTQERIATEIEAHATEFTLRTGMQPRTCYRLILLSVSLKIIGGTFIGMVFLEYVRYYIINDINLLSTMETITESPLCLVKAFTFPYWGVIADRVSRRKIIVLGSVASCVGAWLMCLLPSMSVFVLSRCLSLVADISWPIRDAMLRDIFSSAEWDHLGGGVTGIKSHMAILGAVVAALTIGVGMGLLSLGDMGMIGLGNEYSQRKDQCKGQKHCVTPGKYSWDGDEWRVDGLLRLLMIMGSLALTLEAVLLLVFLPETLRKGSQQETTIVKFVRESWRDFGAPWNNVRVFATRRLRDLTFIRVMYWVILSGGSAVFLCWYRRHALDTLSMYRLGTAGGVTGFLTLLVISRLVDRFGDLRGVWVPAKVLGLLYGLSVALIPASHFYLSFIVFPLFGGPSATFQGFTPGLLAKLIPPDVQATFQTGKAFMFDFQRSISVWPWLALLICSENLPYPLDVLPIWVALVLGAVALWLTLRQVPVDPQNDIREGKALDDFWDTSYVKSGWYARHGGKRSDATTQDSTEDPEWKGVAALDKVLPEVVVPQASAQEHELNAIPKTVVIEDC